MRISPVIYGCKSTSLSQDERAFFHDVQPWGFILFARNVASPGQVERLVAQLRSCVVHDAVPVLIDQEGGRVRRLRPPHWAEYHSAAEVHNLYSKNRQQGLRMAWLQSRLIALDLVGLGINVNCLPVLDVPGPGAHEVIGDRAYGTKIENIIDLGRQAAQGLLDGGVLPVMKHIPGHGRSTMDSHQELPVVSTNIETLKKTDFEPFRQLAKLPVAMTAHVIFEAIDPNAPATTSGTVIKSIIRDYIGFDGLLMCDDLSMRALSGDFGQRTRSCFAAGCDCVLHCSGEMDEMQQVAEALSGFSENGLARTSRAAEYWKQGKQEDEEALREEFSALLSSFGYERDPTEAGE